MHLHCDTLDMQDNFEISNNQAFYITAETLEERLLYDDVFVDYFNAFLQLKAFALPMRYEKLDGFYLDDPNPEDEELQQLVDDRGKFQWQGAITSWIREHRLPYFLRSCLFLEYKLCKLLLRKLLEGSKMPQSQLGLRGYSQADSPAPLPSAQWSSSPTAGYMSRSSWPGKCAEQHHHRPLGSAASLPAMISTAVETRLKLLEGPPGESTVTNVKRTGLEQSENEDMFDSGKCINRAHITMSAQSRRVKNTSRRRTSHFTPFLDKKGEVKRRRSIGSGRRRTQSAPVKGGVVVRTNHRDVYMDECEFNSQYGEDTILDFEEQDGDDEADTELQSIVDETKRNLHEMKEDALNSTHGMEDFQEFLKETLGIHLFNFWIDVERYKDLEESNNESEHTLKLLRIHLFREINDKYKNHLTMDAKRKLTEALNHDGLTREIFTRTQYDMLRRLRSYWIPRFLVHQEKTDKRLVRNQDRKDSRCATALSFLPAISIVHSLPARGDWCTELARRSCDWSKNLILTKRRARSPLKRINSTAMSTYDKFVLAISCEKEAGWPFRCFLDRAGKTAKLAHLLFWQSIEDFKDEEIRGCDRHLHLCNAWSIVKQFLSDEAEIMIDLNKREKENITEKLRDAVEVSSTLFRPSQGNILKTLQAPWEEYIKNDQESLVRMAIVPSAQHSSKGSRNNGKHGLFYHGLFSPGKWYPRYPESSPSERQRRLHTALTIAENIEATRQSLRSPQKSLASTTPKGKAGKKKSKTTKTPSKEKKVEDDDKKDGIDEEPPPEFTDILQDKITMESFKHYIQNAEGRNGMNNIAMFLDIETYKAVPGSKKAERTQLAAQIYKDFFDSSSRKNVDLPPRIPYHVENECPSTGILIEAQQYILPDIQTSFQDFYKYHQDSNHQDSKPAAETTTKQPTNKNTTTKTAPTLHHPPNYLVYYKRRRNKFRGPGRVQPSKEDRFSFIKELQDTYGKFSVTLELFRRYLDNNDDMQGEGASKLENDLLFYLQVQKFKDLFQYMDDTTVVKKVDAIVDCFLDSATPPSVQIDISSDLANRIAQKAQALHSRTKLSREQRDLQIFDDAQNNVMKELLPFWAGFTRQHNSVEEPETKLPPTRRETIVKRRYSEYKKFPLNKRPTNLRCVLPSVGESKRELNFTIAEGLAWKEDLTGDVPSSPYSANVRGSTTSDTRDTTRNQSIIIN